MYTILHFKRMGVEVRDLIQVLLLTSLEAMLSKAVVAAVTLNCAYHPILVGSIGILYIILIPFLIFMIYQHFSICDYKPVKGYMTIRETTTVFAQRQFCLRLALFFTFEYYFTEPLLAKWLPLDHCDYKNLTTSTEKTSIARLVIFLCLLLLLSILECRCSITFIHFANNVWVSCIGTKAEHCQWIFTWKTVLTWVSCIETAAEHCQWIFTWKTVLTWGSKSPIKGKFSKTNKPSKYHCVRAVVEVGESVGLICDDQDTQYATCFVVGNRCILCNYHTLQSISNYLGVAVDPNAILPRIFVRFDRRHGRSNEKRIESLQYTDISLDVVVLKLRDDGGPFPKSLTSFGEARPDEKIEFVGYGKGEKLIDFEGKVRNPCKLDKQDLTNRLASFLMQNGYSKWPHQEPYEGMSPNLLYFDSALQHGCSGSPGMQAESSVSCPVVTLLIGCFPRFLWESEFDLLRDKLDQELCFEFGVNMRAIYDCMKVNAPNLCLEIFRSVPSSWITGHDQEQAPMELH